MENRKKRFSWSLVRNIVSVLLALALILSGVQLVIDKTQTIPKVVIRVGNVEAYTGTPDYVGTTSTQVQQALNALPATGGEVQLISPVYTFTATVSRAINNVTISGMNGTTVNWNGVQALFNVGAQTGWVFRDIRTDAGSITNYTNAMLENVTLGATYFTLRAPNTVGNISAPSITDSGLNAGQAVYAGTGGLLSSEAGYEYNAGTNTLSVPTLSSTTVGATILNAPTGRGATYVIATSDATTTEKAQADLVLGGATDGTSILAALTTLGANAVIQVIGKTVFVDVPIYPTANDQTIRGLGRGSGTNTGATVFYLKNNANCAVFQKNAGTTFYNFNIEDLTIDGNAGNNATGTYGINVSGMGCHVKNVFIRATKSHGLYGLKTGETDTWSSFRNIAITDCVGAGLYFKNFPFATLVEDVTTDSNDIDGMYFENCVSLELLRVNSGANTGYGYHFKACTLGNISHIYCEANASGTWFEDCQTTQVTGFYSSASGSAGDKRALYITGTLWGAAGDGLNFNGAQITSSIASHNALVVNGITRGQIGNVLIYETGATPVGVDVSNTGDTAITVSQYIPNGIRYQSTGGGNQRMWFTDLTNGATAHTILYTVEKTYSSDLFNAAGTTDKVVVFTQPANSTLLSAKFVLNTQFAAVGLSDLEVTVGFDGGVVDGLIGNDGGAMNLFSDAVDTQYFNRSGASYWAAANTATYYTGANLNWTAFATATGANLNTLTAGKITIYFTYIQF